MGRRSSVCGAFMHVKTVVSLERFEVGNLATAAKSLSDLKLLSWEKIETGLLAQESNVGSRNSCDIPF